MTQTVELPTEELEDGTEEDDVVHHITHTLCQRSRSPALTFCGVVARATGCWDLKFSSPEEIPDRCPNGHQMCPDCVQLYTEWKCFYC